MRFVTFNVASIDGRIAVARSTPSSLDPRWTPLDRFEPVDVLSLHGARVCLEGSGSFAGRDAPEPAFGDRAAAVAPAGDFRPASLRAHRGGWFVVIVGHAGAPAIFEGYDPGASGSIRDLDLISAEARPDASIFVRYAAR